MDTNVEVQPAAAPVVQPKVRKPKPKTTRNDVQLSLPMPTRADGAQDVTLFATMGDKFQKAILVRTGASKPEQAGVPIFGNSSLGHAARFVAAMLNSYSSGLGLSSEGSASYVAEHIELIKKSLPSLINSYDLVFSLNQAGAATYRVPLATMLPVVLSYAKEFQRAVKMYGHRKPVHKVGGKSVTPAVVLPK